MMHTDDLRNMTRQDLMSRIGRIEQIAGVRRVRLVDGPGAGVELAQFRTGTGFDFSVALSRGMDIAEASFQGQSLCWQGAPGLTSPAHYDPRGLEWLRMFMGGLLSTCGLAYAGAPCQDGDAALGLHGRYTSLAADHICVEGQWVQDEYVMQAKGRMCESQVFGEKLVLTRTISAKLGEARLCIEDCVENQGHTPAEHMIVYHCNFGYPLVSETTRLNAPSQKQTPVVPGVATKDWDCFLPPTPGFREWVYYHDLTPADDGSVTVSLNNAAKGLKAYLKYEARVLPRFIQWKMCGQGEYVLGLEPANCGVEGRAVERERGTLQVLQPDEQRIYRLEIGIES